MVEITGQALADIAVLDDDLDFRTYLEDFLKDEGAYTVRAFGTNRVVVGAPLTLLGPGAEEGGEQRGADEPLLAPMPSPQPATATAPRPAALPQPRPVAVSTGPIAPWWALVLVGIALAAGLFVVARSRLGRASESHR
jgi:hypothetical protein